MTLRSLLNYFVPALFILFGLLILIRPDAAVRFFHERWKNDVLPFNRRLANPEKLPQQRVLFRLIGAGWILIASMIIALTYFSRG